MKNLTLILFFSIMVLSCNNPYPTYKEIEKGVFMKLLYFEDEKVEIGVDNFIKVDMKIYDGDKLVYHQFPEYYLSPDNSFHFFLKSLNKNEVSAFFVKKNLLKEKVNFFEVLNFESDYLKILVNVYEVIDKEKYQEVLEKKHDPEMIEQIILKKILAEHNVKKNDYKQGVYVLQEKKGVGEAISKGDVIEISYKAYFTNLLEFDSTDNQSKFEFTYGTPDQVIEGLQIALKGMRKGEKSKIFIPSQLAFGEEGSSTGIVPPYATVIYELEIVNVK